MIKSRTQLELSRDGSRINLRSLSSNTKYVYHRNDRYSFSFV